MNKQDFEAFKRAWKDYPSQDNEGYRPDRGSFKCGFSAGLEHREQEIKRLREALEECAKPPYRDSDLSSLIQAINAIARTALEGK